MNKIIPNGTEVLIFQQVPVYHCSQEEDENFVIGVIQSSKQSDDLSYHGSPYYEQVYKVLGNDGKIYSGTYERGLVGNYFFRTREDHIEVLKEKIKDNEKEILKLQEKTNSYIEQIKSLKEPVKVNTLKKKLAIK